MSSRSGPVHVVVDGSNIATEGRSMPSLTQLNEAVMAFMEEHPDALVTVVVDATFGHRIPKSESQEFEAGISNNELVAPPAGAVGRGDAFVLGIADKAGAAVLSNDSFQEFHGEYEWLFDEGRLIGGKPVPHVGWVFVDRVPVRGPVSRKATRSTKGTGDSSKSSSKRSRSGGARRSGKASKAASEPMPVPTSPPPGRGAPTPEPAAQPDTPDTSDSSASDGRRRAPRANEPVNDLLPFLEFVEHHPVGTSVNGTVDAYSSHGAYVTIGDQGVRAYVPLRLMADPPPRSARKVMKVGESVTLVVVSFAPERRSIDCAVPDMAEREIADVAAASSDPELVAQATSEAADGGAGGDSAAEAGGTPPKRTRKKTATRKTAAKKAATKKAAAKKAATKKAAAKKSTAKKPAAKKSTAKKPAAKKAATKKTAARKKAASRKSAAEATSAEQTPTKKTATKKAAAKKTTGRKTAAKRTGAKKSTARKTAARRSAKTSAAAESASPSPAAEAPADDPSTTAPPADAEG